MLTQDFLTWRAKNAMRKRNETRSQTRWRLGRIYTSYAVRERLALTDIHVLRSERVKLVVAHEEGKRKWSLL